MLKKVLNMFVGFQLRVYLRTYALDQMVQAASSSAGLRTIKRVEQTLQDLGVCFLHLVFSTFKTVIYGISNFSSVLYLSFLFGHQLKNIENIFMKLMFTLISKGKVIGNII